MILIQIVGGSIAAIYIVWLYFLAVMCLEAANDKAPLAGMTRAFAYTIFLPGYLLDFLLNMTVLTLLLLELPREGLVTARLSRHINAPVGWRKAIAQWFCATLLDKFDPRGCHCK